MNRILEIDRENLFAVVEPGVVTETLQDAAETAGLFYPPDPSSRGSCTIGGNIAENAGGPRAAKYGTTGRYVAGLRVALPGGSVLALGGKNRKDVAGYDLVSLFVGSEGTLGVVTRRRCGSCPCRRTGACSGPRSRGKSRPWARSPACTPAGRSPRPASSWSAARRRWRPSGSPWRFPPTPTRTSSSRWTASKSPALRATPSGSERMLLAAGATDVRVAMTEREQRDFWRLRRGVGEAVKKLGPYAEEDCAVPRSRMPELLRSVRDVAARHGLTAVCYGHAADGNIHVNVVQPPGGRELWLSRRDAAVEEIFRAVVALGGTITGEHGVGLTQRAYMRLRHSPEVLGAMRAVKSLFDPDGLLNPGKIFAT